MYSAAELRSLDRRAQTELGRDGYALMQAAAQAAWCHVRAMAGDTVPALPLQVLCGPGNNGGDGYELARLAKAAGWPLRLWRVGPPPAAGEALQAYRAWRLGGGVEQVWQAEALAGCGSGCLIVDALLGIGLSRPVGGEFAGAIESINAAGARGARVLSLDLPSGLDADSGLPRPLAVRARRTLSFIADKAGFHLGEGPEHVGELHRHRLRLPEAFLASAVPVFRRLHRRDLAGALPPRARDAHKGRHGHVLVIGGDQGMAGAALLAGQAALRSGAGLVSLATRAGHAAALTAAQPELMAAGTETAAELLPRLEACRVLALGPGLGLSAWSQALYQASWQLQRPKVLDADALNWLARAPRRLPADCVLTPHPGEAARLLGCDTGEIQQDRLAAVRALHQRYGGVVVLKGAGTLIAGEQIWLCPYGNPGMAVGGMGDLLTGIIAALLAQGLAAEPAARTGVLLHALAGDAAAAVGGQRGLLPSDLLPELRRLANP